MIHFKSLAPPKTIRSLYNSICYKNDECGRSLTEMLGTLAIMGIIGLTGIKMFHSAINGHRANELINEANKRAIVVAMQVTAGRSELSIGEFKDPEGYTFGVAKENDQQFKITLGPVDEEICTRMKNSVGPATAIRKIEDNCTEIIYNNDLSVTTEAQCTGSGKIWCAATGLCSETGTCCGGKDCSASACPTGSSPDGVGGTTGIFVNGSECKCELETAVYTGTRCEAQPATCHDWTQNECGFGYYCAFNYEVEQTGAYDYDNQSCYQQLEGICTKINISPLLEWQVNILTKAGLKSTLVRGPRTNWWSAYSWCLGQGKHMLNVEEIECYRASDNTLLESGKKNWSFCCKKGNQCQQSAWTNMWNNLEIVSGQEEEVNKFSDKMVALKKIYVWDYAWLSSPAGANGSQNSCTTFGFNFSGGNLYPPHRNEHHIHALCQ